MEASLSLLPYSTWRPTVRFATESNRSEIGYIAKAVFEEIGDHFRKAVAASEHRFVNGEWPKIDDQTSFLLELIYSQFLNWTRSLVWLEGTSWRTIYGYPKIGSISEIEFWVVAVWWNFCGVRIYLADVDNVGKSPAFETEELY